MLACCKLYDRSRGLQHHRWPQLPALLLLPLLAVCGLADRQYIWEHAWLQAGSSYTVWYQSRWSLQTGSAATKGCRADPLQSGHMSFSSMSRQLMPGLPKEHDEPLKSMVGCRLAAAVTEEGKTGVPLQHLSEMVSVQGFDSDRWVAAQPKDNEVRPALQLCQPSCAWLPASWAVWPALLGQ